MNTIIVEPCAGNLHARFLWGSYRSKAQSGGFEL